MHRASLRLCHFFAVFQNQIRRERRERKRCSVWLEFFEQRKAAAIHGNQLWPGHGQTDIHLQDPNVQYQVGLTRLSYTLLNTFAFL